MAEGPQGCSSCYHPCHQPPVLSDSSRSQPLCCMMLTTSICFAQIRPGPMACVPVCALLLGPAALATAHPCWMRGPKAMCDAGLNSLLTLNRSSPYPGLPHRMSAQDPRVPGYTLLPWAGSGLCLCWAVRLISPVPLPQTLTAQAHDSGIISLCSLQRLQHLLSVLTEPATPQKLCGNSPSTVSF